MGCILWVQNNELYFTLITTVMYLILYRTGPCFNGTWLSLRRMKKHGEWKTMPWHHHPWYRSSFPELRTMRDYLSMKKCQINYACTTFVGCMPFKCQFTHRSEDPKADTCKRIICIQSRSSYLRQNTVSGFRFLSNLILFSKEHL